MYRWLPIVMVLFFVVRPAVAQDDSTGGFSPSYFCRSTVLRRLFNLQCDTAAFDRNEIPADQTDPSLQLRFFDVPPTSTPTPSATPTVVPGQPGFTQTPVSQNGTQQVDWVYNDRGVCWSAWAGASCSLLAHEGGLMAGPIDINGDSQPDVTCSQGTGVNQRTAITNISSQPIPLRCERYTCSSCQSSNGTHAQCDGQIDPSSVRVAQDYVLQPGETQTCTWTGIGGSGNPGSTVPGDPTAPTSTPVPAQPPLPENPPQRPTPTLPPGQQPPVNTRCRVGTGHCSVENLLRYFPDYTAAFKASVICQAESGSNPLAANRACTTGGTVDYSIGLYQINLLAHCEGAATYTWNPPSCRIVDRAKLDQCENDYKNPDFNIRKAVQLSDNGTDWYPTWGAAAPQYCNIP